MAKTLSLTLIAACSAVLFFCGCWTSTGQVNYSAYNAFTGTPPPPYQYEEKGRVTESGWSSYAASCDSAADEIEGVLREHPELQSERTKKFLEGDMGRPKGEPKEQIEIRLPVKLLERARKLAERLDGMTVLDTQETTTSDVLREAIEIGMGKIEAKLKRKRRK